MPVSGQRDHRNSHPQGFTGGCGSVVRKGIKCNIHLIIQGKMLVFGLNARHHPDLLGHDTVLSKHLKITAPGGFVRQLAALEQNSGMGNLLQDLRPCGHHVLIHLAQIVERAKGGMMSFQKRQV